ncbi:adenosylcobinamide-phosphate synthase CbiB [Synechococcus sp. PCC 7336]|uniref:adenosylcobinamide-phosphate synthase CbiB n=1 Tax=Synechococcus sp. PCC 7336 TaxID=195250 RepID=UPI00034770C5
MLPHPPPAIALAGALLLDFLLADPWSWYHPVQAMGAAIALGKRLILQICPQPRQQQWGGAVLTGLLLLGSYAFAATSIWLATRWHPWAGVVTHVVLLASCLGAKSLRLAALSLLPPLQQQDLPTARHLLSRYVGRDTEALDEAEICRAAIETVAENTPDGATAPLFYAAIGGAPLAFAYKALSTLDSMVGYRREPYTHLGRVPARLEDAATWLPCRLTAIALALWSREPWQYLRRCASDACQDPSPNSGWSEAAFAWLLGVQLGGENLYGGVKVLKPRLGKPNCSPTPTAVQESVTWLRKVMLCWLGGISLLYAIACAARRGIEGFS